MMDDVDLVVGTDHLIAFFFGAHLDCEQGILQLTKPSLTNEEQPKT